MSNQILDAFYEGENFVGYLAVDNEGSVLFGYDADWAQKDGYSLCGERHTGYCLLSFEGEAQAREWLAEQISFEGEAQAREWLAEQNFR